MLRWGCDAGHDSGNKQGIIVMTTAVLYGLAFVMDARDIDR